MIRLDRQFCRSSLVAAFAVLTMVVPTFAPATAWAAKGDCGQPSSTGTKPSTTDCLYILRTAVGTLTCKSCICDTDDSKTITTVDALRCLKKAVGQTVTMKCPVCTPVTTTTAGPPVSSTSTTTTSTTSTTTTLPVQCSSNADCSGLPVGFRCNPHTQTCEKPCNVDKDCKDFYECNKTTHYCQEPALLY